VIHVGVGNQDMVDTGLLFHRQNRRRRPGIEKDLRIDQETRQTVSGALRTVATQYPDFHAKESLVLNAIHTKRQVICSDEDKKENGQAATISERPAAEAGQVSLPAGPLSQPPAEASGLPFSGWRR
jgi:hypothetical protein